MLKSASALKFFDDDDEDSTNPLFKNDSMLLIIDDEENESDDPRSLTVSCVSMSLANSSALTASQVMYPKPNNTIKNI